MKYRSCWLIFTLRSKFWSHCLIIWKYNTHASNSLWDIRQSHWTMKYRAHKPIFILRSNVRSYWPLMHTWVVNMASLCLNPYSICFVLFLEWLFLVIPPRFIEIIMLSGWVGGTMTKTRMGVGSDTFMSMVPIRGQYVFLISKFRKVYIISTNYSHELLILLFSSKEYAYKLDRTLETNQNMGK